VPHFALVSPTSAILRMFPLLFMAMKAAAAEGWPADLREVAIRSSADQTSQPSMWWTPPGSAQPRPLLVGLHTWSSDYRQTGSSFPYWQWCRAQGWHFIHPNFRGANRTPEALGSDLAVQDIVDAVAWAKANANVDARRIYLIGVSGGGHMALLAAGRHPEIWAGVSAWCGIVDIARWHAEHSRDGEPDRYAREIEAALGGPPDSAPRQADARRRSPLAWLSAARGVPLDIAAGVHDGRTGSVPFKHSLDAFNAVVAPAARLAPAEVDSFYSTQALPAAWGSPVADPSFGKWRPLFRAVHGNTRVTIFEGGHEIVHQAALNWLRLQERGRPAAWDVHEITPLPTPLGQSRSGL